ncbi:MAG TPA: response regulator [bacterium]
MSESRWMEVAQRSPEALPRVVVAEDDEALAIVIQGKLARSGYRVHVERDGAAAWTAIQAEQPDLVVLDWMMPELDGLTLLAMMRDNAVTKNIPVIMLTAMAQPEDVKTAIATGANDYLIKPFKPEDLANRAGRLVKTTRPAPRVAPGA